MFFFPKYKLSNYIIAAAPCNLLLNLSFKSNMYSLHVPNALESLGWNTNKIVLFNVVNVYAQ